MYLDQFCLDMMRKYPGMSVAVVDGTFIMPYVITRTSDGKEARTMFDYVEAICAGMTDKISDDLQPYYRKYAESVKAEDSNPHKPGPPVSAQ